MPEWGCRACGGEVVEWGRLGLVRHGRCRSCGLAQHQEDGPEPDVADEWEPDQNKTTETQEE